MCNYIDEQLHVGTWHNFKYSRKLKFLIYHTHFEKFKSIHMINTWPTWKLPHGTLSDFLENWNKNKKFNLGHMA